MPTTPNFSLPFPSLSAVPNVPADIEALAEATDAAMLDQSVPASGEANIPSGLSIGTTWTWMNTLTWSAGGGAVPNGAALNVPAGLYLVNVRLNLQSLGADGYVQLRGGQVSAGYDLGGIAIAGGASAHWHEITGIYPIAAQQDIRIYLASNAARNANFCTVHIVRLGSYAWTP